MLLLRARVERALAALDERDRDGDLMALQRAALFSSLENDAWLLRSWNRSRALSARSLARPFVSSITSPFINEAAPEQVLSKEELARAHQQFLQSLPPRELTLFAARPSTPEHPEKG